MTQPVRTSLLPQSQAPAPTPAPPDGKSQQQLTRLAERLQAALVQEQVESPASLRRSFPASAPPLATASLPLPTPAPRLAGSPRTAPLSRPAGNSTWSFALSATPAEETALASLSNEDLSSEPEASEFTAATETVNQHFSVFDQPHGGELDQQISDEDFRAVADGNYDEQAVRADLAAQGLNPEQVDAAIADIEQAAEFFAESETYRNGLASQDGNADRVTPEDVAGQLADSRAYDAAVAEHGQVDEIDNPQQAIEVLTEFLPYADTAAHGGEADQTVSRDDLQAILEDPNAPASVKAAAAYLLAEENEVIFNAIDGAGQEGSANGEINLYNLENAAQDFESFGHNVTEIETTADAINVLAGYEYLADGANGGGEGASDGQISYADLEKLANSPAVPAHVREAARHVLTLREENPTAMSVLGNGSLSVENLQAFAAAPPELQRALVSHVPTAQGLIQMVDGQPVWADTGQPLTPEEYSALSTQWQAQLQDVEAPTLIDPMLLGRELDEIQFEHTQQLDELQQDLASAQAEIEQEQALYSQFLAEYGHLLSPAQKAQLEAEHQQRLDALQQPFEQYAEEFVALAEDPYFQQTFANLSQEEQERFFQTVADQVGNTEAGAAFADQLFGELAQLGSEQNPAEASELSVYTQVAAELVTLGSNAQTFQEAFTVLASRHALNGGASDTLVDATRAVHGEAAADALAETISDLESGAMAADQADSPQPYENARNQAASELNGDLDQIEAERPGAGDYLSVVAFAVDVATIGEHGLGELTDPAFALGVTADAADATSVLVRAIGVGKGAASTLSNVAGGIGVVLGAFDVFSGLSDGDYVQAASGALSVVGSALILAGVGGPVGPILAAGSLVVAFLPGLFDQTPYENYIGDRFDDLDIPRTLTLFADFPPEVQQAIAAKAEETGLTPSQVTILVLRGLSDGGFSSDLFEGGPGALENIEEGFEYSLSNSVFQGNEGINSEEDLEAFTELEEQTGLNSDELYLLLGQVGQDEYLEFLQDHPTSTISYAQFLSDHVVELAPQALEAFEQSGGG